MRFFTKSYIEATKMIFKFLKENSTLFTEVRPNVFLTLTLPFMVCLKKNKRVFC